MRIRTCITTVTLSIALFAMAPAHKAAQGRNSEALLQQALDQIESAAKCGADDNECAAEAKKDGKKFVLIDDEGKILAADKQPKDSPAKNADAVEAANARAAGTDAAEPTETPQGKGMGASKANQPNPMTPRKAGSRIGGSNSSKCSAEIRNHEKTADDADERIKALTGPLMLLSAHPRHPRFFHD
jgi:hypothetical protein